MNEGDEEKNVNGENEKKNVDEGDVYR